MKVNEVAKTIMKISNVTQKDLADKYGKSGQSTISMILSAKNMRIDNLLMILNECGYQLVARSVDGDRPEYIIGDEHAVCNVGDNSRDAIKDVIRETVAEELDKRGYSPRPQLAIDILEEEDI